VYRTSANLLGSHRPSHPPVLVVSQCSLVLAEWLRNLKPSGMASSASHCPAEARHLLQLYSLNFQQQLLMEPFDLIFG
jgi:hypothetical protein